MSFSPSSALLVGYIACYAPVSCLEYEKNITNIKVDNELNIMETGIT